MVQGDLKWKFFIIQQGVATPCCHEKTGNFKLVIANAEGMWRSNFRTWFKPCPV